MKKALGKGLSALIPEEVFLEKVVNLKIEEIHPNRYQPRERFSEEAIEELANSIKEKGLLQPIVVRRSSRGYEIIAGERRLRAMRKLGKTHIPAIIKESNDQESLQLSLIENIQREDLNPLEEAKAYQLLQERFGLTQEQIATATGKARTTITNVLRLLKLSPQIQEFIKKGLLNMSQARSLLSLEKEEERLALCKEIVSKQLSVREIENIIQKRPPSKSKYKSLFRDPELTSWQEKLQEKIGTRVKIVCKKKGGYILLEFYSPQDLERLIEFFLQR